MALPANYSVYGTSANGDQLILQRSDASSLEPRYMTIDRKQASYNQKSQTFSIPTYRIRISRGLKNVDNVPIPEKMVADLTIRMPVGYDSQVDTLVGDLNGLIDNANFLAWIKALNFPS